ncbi:hypothetical protein ACI5KX_13965 [Erythrobacter sp. GH1-10]|uniref:hypothetical protein n=1 Tax=Erythrobacter sp. GH1-10 TaxID=3349334 RepID=UPI00387835B8
MPYSALFSPENVPKRKRSSIIAFPVLVFLAACGGENPDAGENELNDAEGSSAEIAQDRQIPGNSDPSVGTSSGAEQSNPRLVHVQMVAPQNGDKDLILFSQAVEISDMELLQLSSKLTMWMREERPQYGATTYNGSVSAVGEQKLAQRLDEKKAELEKEGHTVEMVEIPIETMLGR